MTGRETALPEMQLELVPVPVLDVDQAKAFYQQAGFHLEVDVQTTGSMRVGAKWAT